MSILDIQDAAYEFDPAPGHCMFRAMEAVRLAELNGYKAEIVTEYRSGGPRLTDRDYNHAYVVIDGVEILNNPNSDKAWLKSVRDNFMK
jgi:hypothetical protein